MFVIVVLLYPEPPVNLHITQILQFIKEQYSGVLFKVTNFILQQFVIICNHLNTNNCIFINFLCK